MDGMALGVFLVGTFIGGLTSGISGFAMGVVLSGIWSHILLPRETTTLIVFCGLLTQSYAIWKLRHALIWRNLLPFVLGGAIGVPIGALMLSYIDPVFLRTGLGALLVFYSGYSLAQPTFKPVRAGLAADVVVGVLNGLLGGLTGLTGIIVTIWCGLRGWPKDVQRTVFQPVNLTNIVMSAVSLSLAGAVTTESVKLYFYALPLLLTGLWSGFKLYGNLGDTAFRKIMLLLLLLSGLTLIVPKSIFR